MPEMEHVFEYDPGEINVEWSVVCGQTFRWTLDDDGWWSALLYDHASRTNVLFFLKQENSLILLRSNSSRAAALFGEYFRTEIGLRETHSTFGETSAKLHSAIGRFSGLRVLRQDPVECLFSFICTSAAPLHRIRKSVTGMCKRYGESISHEGATYFAFPTVQALADATEQELRDLGLGYRATFIRKAAAEILDRGGELWLRNLRTAPYDDAKLALTKLTGIGDKIADCICLFSLDKDEAVPVDTHVRRLVTRDYTVAAGGKRTEPSNSDIANAFRASHPRMAGWAQQYLFFAELYERGAWSSYLKMCCK